MTTRTKTNPCRTFAAIIACIFIAASTPATAATRVQIALPTGLWINPTHSVEVTTVPCGVALCGRISWANSLAIADARDGGVMQLTGTEILEDYHRTGPATWQGRVLVPDMGRSFHSTLTLVDAERLKVSGCVLGGLFCKSQIWIHVPMGAGQP